MYCLPSEYQHLHEYSIVVYNQILEVFKKIENSGFLKIEIKPKSQQDCEIIKSLTGEDLYKWLNSNGYNDVVFEMDYRNCYAALISDMLQFILTALNCSEKGQLSVTYALLRKPLKDNLFYLQYLLVDPTEFLNKYNSPNSAHELEFKDGAIANDKIKNIISLALDKTQIPIFTADFLYSLLFDKKNDRGFEPLFEMANHLITGHRFYKTEEGNFNFIFSNNDSKESQWDFLYTFLPSILFYIFSINKCLVERFVTFPKFWPLLQARLLLGLSYYQESQNYESVKNRFSILFQDTETECDLCHEKIVFDEDQFLNFINRFIIKCKKCGNEYSLAGTA